MGNVSKNLLRMYLNKALEYKALKEDEPGKFKDLMEKSAGPKGFFVDRLAAFDAMMYSLNSLGFEVEVVDDMWVFDFYVEDSLKEFVDSKNLLDNVGTTFLLNIMRSYQKRDYWSFNHDIGDEVILDISKELVEKAIGGSVDIEYTPPTLEGLDIPVGISIAAESYNNAVHSYTYGKEALLGLGSKARYSHYRSELLKAAMLCLNYIGFNFEYSSYVWLIPDQPLEDFDERLEKVVGKSFHTNFLKAFISDYRSGAESFSTGIDDNMLFTIIRSLIIKMPLEGKNLDSVVRSITGSSPDEEGPSKETVETFHSLRTADNSGTGKYSSITKLSPPTESGGGDPKYQIHRHLTKPFRAMRQYMSILEEKPRDAGQLGYTAGCIPVVEYGVDRLVALDSLMLSLLGLGLDIRHQDGKWFVPYSSLTDWEVAFGETGFVLDEFSVRTLMSWFNAYSSGNAMVFNTSVSETTLNMLVTDTIHDINDFITKKGVAPVNVSDSNQFTRYAFEEFRHSIKLYHHSDRSSGRDRKVGSKGFLEYRAAGFNALVFSLLSLGFSADRSGECWDLSNDDADGWFAYLSVGNRLSIQHGECMQLSQLISLYLDGDSDGFNKGMSDTSFYCLVQKILLQIDMTLSRECVPSIENSYHVSPKSVTSGASGMGKSSSFSPKNLNPVVLLPEDMDNDTLVDHLLAMRMLQLSTMYDQEEIADQFNQVRQEVLHRMDK